LARHINSVLKKQRSADRNPAAFESWLMLPWFILVILVHILVYTTLFLALFILELNPIL
jgi:hypothetical protein